MNEKQIVKTQDKTVTTGKKYLKDWLASDEFKSQVQLALPRHLKSDRFIRIAITALTRTPKLSDCTQESVFKCLLDLSAMGLEPDGRRAHLLPYGNQCTLILDYKGIVELAYRSGEVSNIHADKVCDNDIFVYNKGNVEKHEIDFRKDRGKPYCYYCIIKLKDGTEKAEVMSIAEIEEIRKRSKSANAGPWVSDFSEMAKKTVFRRASKWITLSPELRDHIEKDADVIDIGEEQPKPLKPIFGTTKKVEEVPEEPEHKEPDAKTMLSIRLEEHEIKSLDFEAFLKKQNILSTAETLEGISEEKAKEILENLGETIKEMKKK